MGEIQGNKTWWSGDSRVEEFMKPLRFILDENIEDRDLWTNIYNRAYEAVYNAIIKHSVSDSFKLAESHEMTEFYLDRFLSEDERFRLLLKGQKIGYHTNIKDLGAGCIISFLKESEK